MVKPVVYTEPNIPLLEGIAKELGVKLEVDADIRQAQKLYEQGIRVPGTEGGHTPQEMAYLLQILRAVQERGEVPRDLHIYLEDRGLTRLPETVPTLVRRETLGALGDLIKGVEQLSTRIQCERGK